MDQGGDQLTYSVIGKAMECHRELGPGLEEIFYHELLVEKLNSAGIAYKFKPKGRLFHRGILADEFEADLLVSDELALELKVLWETFAPEHLLQIICYLKFWRLRRGLLFDFGKESLVQQRVAFTAPLADFDTAHWQAVTSALVTDQTSLRQVAQAIQRVLTDHGLGYRDTTYRGLLFAELTAEGIECVREPVVGIRFGQGLLRESRLGCLVLPGKCALLVVALRDTRHVADRAVLQTYLKHLCLPWGVVINFGKRRLETQIVQRPSVQI